MEKLQTTFSALERRRSNTMEKLVVDTNAVAAALVKEGTSRQILLVSGISFFEPDFLKEELEEHKDTFLAKSGLSAEDYEKVMNVMLANIVQIPAGSYVAFRQKALELTQDHDDWPFLALALSLSCPIWSNDWGMKGQTEVKVYNTGELVGLMRLLEKE